MTDLTPLRLEHLSRLTDAQGLMRSAEGDCPDRFSGYDAIDNADALRLCATASDTVDADTLRGLAQRYYAFLVRARSEDGRIRHHCDAKGTWSDRAEDGLVQARLARALAAVIASELPVQLRLAASPWWSELIGQADQARTPCVAAHWLMAIASLPAAHPGRGLDRCALLARWLIEDSYYPIRCSEWEWFESSWSRQAACIPMSLWMAHEVLGEERLATVAQAATRFVIEHLFEDGLFLPVGTQGNWHRNASKPIFDQLPAETCSVVELLCTAEQVSGSLQYGRYADYAHRWFTGNNIRGISLIDPASGGCGNAIRTDRIDRNQGAAAIVACLQSQAALATRPVVVAEPPIHMAYVHG